MGSGLTWRVVCQRLKSHPLRCGRVTVYAEATIFLRCDRRWKQLQIPHCVRDDKRFLGCS
jgi:hypothetical protein